MLGSLITWPLRLGVRAASLAVEETIVLASRVLALIVGGEDDSDRADARVPVVPPPPVATEETAIPVPPAEPVAPPPPPTPTRTRSPTPRPSPAPPPPEPAASAEPAHVSEGLEVVSETADSGAQDGAGAQLRIAEPWPGYGTMTARDVIDRLVSASREELAAVELYERSRRGRKTVVAAAERALKRASPPPHAP